jgi:hypothetical protein
MAITPGYDTVKESNEVEQHYIDKGAVKTPQVLPKVENAYREALAEADRIDYVEWPTQVRGQETQGF